LKRLLQIVAVAVITAGVFNINAYDQQISSRLWAEGYSVQAPGGVLISRRRFVEDLHLGAWNLLPGSDAPYYQGPRLSINVSLRLAADAFVGKNESNSGAQSSYIPGLTPMEFDAMFAFIAVEGLFSNTLDIRAGRQVRIDTFGFFAYDGVELGIRLPIHIEMDTFIGYEVRGGQVMGYDSLELDGTDNGGRNDMSSDQYPDRTEPNSRLAMGTQLSFTPREWLAATASFRAVGVSEELADERVGGQLTVGSQPIRSDFRVVWSPAIDDLSEADVEIAVTPLKALALIAEYHLYHPVFEANSIFNVFNLSDQNDLGGRVELRINKKIKSAVWGYARLSEGSAGLFGEEEDALVAGAGGGIGANYKTQEAGLSARFSLLQEWGETRIGGELGGTHAFLRGDRLWLGIRMSVWHLDDDFSERLSGTLAGYVVSARVRIGKGAYLLGEFEQYVGGVQDARTSVLGLLQLDLWR
jgi:hypothetical protein